MEKQGRCHEGPLVTIAGKTKQQGRWPGSPRSPHPHTSGCTASSVWLWDIALGLHWIGVPTPTASPCRVGPLGPKPPDHKEVLTFPENTEHFLPPSRDLKSQRSTRELKILWLSTTYWKTMDRLLINLLEKCQSYLCHRCDKEGIHQIPWITKVTRQLRKKILKSPDNKLKEMEIYDLNNRKFKMAILKKQRVTTKHR